MRALIAQDHVQLRRIESAIARIEHGSPAEQLRRACLLSALRHERAVLLEQGAERGTSTAGHRPAQFHAAA
jgi:hypothetical protein